MTAPSTPISHDEAEKHLDALQTNPEYAPAGLTYMRQYVAEQREEAKKHRALLKAVLGTFEARDSGMDTLLDRIELARAAASLQGTKAVAYLTFEDQCAIVEDDIEWDPAVDGDLDEDAVKSPDGDVDDEGGLDDDRR